jgi:hypothetical protein
MTDLLYLFEGATAPFFAASPAQCELKLRVPEKSVKVLLHKDGLIQAIAANGEEKRLTMDGNSLKSTRIATAFWEKAPSIVKRGAHQRTVSGAQPKVGAIDFHATRLDRFAEAMCHVREVSMHKHFVVRLGEIEARRDVPPSLIPVCPNRRATQQGCHDSRSRHEIAVL